MKTSIQWRLGLILLSVVIACSCSAVHPVGRTARLWRTNVSKISLGSICAAGATGDAGGDGQGRRAAVDNIISDLQTTAASQAVSAQFTRDGQDVSVKFDEALRTRWRPS